MWIAIFLNKSNGFNVCLSILMHPTYQQWWKNELLLWKLSFIWMKILNNIACNLNWIQILLKKNKIQNWCTRYWKSTCHFHHSWLWCSKNVSLKTKDSPKKQLCIIVTMVLDILFGIVKTRPICTKDPLYTSFEILINRMIYVRQTKKIWVYGL